MLCWTVHLKGPDLTFGHAAVTVGHKVYTFGNDHSRFKNSEIDVHVFNTLSLRWKKLPLWATGRESPLEVPSGRLCPTAVLIEDMIYIWGGTPYGKILYAFDVDTHRWFKPVVSGTVPEERERHSACVLGKAMYIYGGFNRESGFIVTNDIYKLDTITMVWTLINTRGTTGPSTELHTSTIIGTKMFVFGGILDNDLYHIRVFDTETNLWLSTPSAQQLTETRIAHSAFTYSGELYIFGGRTVNGFNDDMWKFSPETFTWKKVEPSWKMAEPKEKGPRHMYSMNCCMVGDCAIFFGGFNTRHDLYILDFSPSLKTFCKLAVIQYGLDQSELPHDIRWELEALTAANSNRKRPWCF